MAIWRETLAEVLAMGCEHLSCYELSYEEDTPFFEQFQAGKTEANDDLACAMYDELLATANAAGFAQYEISNFARRLPNESGEIPTRACQHNVNYWRGGSFHGLGPSAAAYVEGVRTKNWSDTLRYCECLERGERAVESSERLEPLRRAGEIAAFGLRMTAGWPLDAFLERTGFDLRDHWQAEIKDLCGRGNAVIEPNRFKLTAQGLRFADQAAEMFLR
jgi:oxygen-independent coproporphyrinogen-3 oxidase